MVSEPFSDEILCFRVDKRPLVLGKDFRTAGAFSELHPEHGKRAEEFLEEHRPSAKPRRSSSLMLFDSEPAARWHCAKMSGSSLYAVKISASQILHRGDMRIVDQIGRAFLEGNVPSAEMAERYWSSELSGNHIAEILLLSAKPDRKLDFDRTAEWKAQLNITPFEPLDIAHLFGGEGRLHEEKDSGK